MPNKLLQSLNDEWADLLHRSQPEVEAWGLAHPVLAGCADPSQILFAVRGAPDAVLGALIHLDRAGSALAGRIVLQAMLGKMVSLAVRDPVSGLDDYVAALWLRIRSYPLERRPRSIAANLALDARKTVFRDRRPTRQAIEASTIEGDDSQLANLPVVVDLTAYRVLRTAGELGLIDEPTRRLLVEVYVDGWSGREVAQRWRISPALVRYRCSRAVRRLADQAVDLTAAVSDLCAAG